MRAFLKSIMDKKCDFLSICNKQGISDKIVCLGLAS